MGLCLGSHCQERYSILSRPLSTKSRVVRGETAGSEHVNNMLDANRDAMETVKIQAEEVVHGILWESLFVLELGC